MTRTVTPTDTPTDTATQTRTPSFTPTYTSTSTSTPSPSATPTGTPLIGLVAIAPGQSFAAAAPGYLGAPANEEAGILVTITVREVEMNTWTIQYIPETIHLTCAQPAGTYILDQDKALVNGVAVFYVRLLKPGMAYAITAADISGPLGSATTLPIPVVISAYGDFALTNYSKISVNSAVAGQQNIQVMSFTVTNPNAGPMSYSLAGVTLTVNSAANNFVASVTVSDGAAFTKTTAWGAANAVFVDMYDPANPISGGMSRTYTISINLSAAAVNGSFTLSIANALDVYVSRLDGSVVNVEPSGVAYPYITNVVNITSKNLDTSFYSYPNPFKAGSESAQIQYYLPSNSKVSFAIYDLIGRKVCTLLNAQDEPGGVIYTLNWDGRNQDKKIVLNGVYYGMLYTGDEQHITKIAVIK